MSDFPWSDNQNAPQLKYGRYHQEKVDFAADVVGAILYGITVTLFFQCMTLLLNPVDRKRGVKWGLVTHTIAIFSFNTINNAFRIHSKSWNFVAGRYSSPDGVSGMPTPVAVKVFNTVSSSMFQLNQWLLDGLLLYRCNVIYGMNHWIVAVPFLMYLASLATGAILIFYLYMTEYRQFMPEHWRLFYYDFIFVYYSVSLSLNVFLTLMIAGRLFWHSRNFQRVLGAPPGNGGLYRVVIATLIESSALYTISHSLYIALEFNGGGKAHTPGDFFLPICTQAQVISPLLLILRVTDRTTPTSSTVKSENISSIRFGSRGESMGGDGVITEGCSISSAEDSWKTPSEGSEVTFIDVL